jgi:homoserine trans-succinylase
MDSEIDRVKRLTVHFEQILKSQREYNKFRCYPDFVTDINKEIKFHDLASQFCDIHFKEQNFENYIEEEWFNKGVLAFSKWLDKYLE